MTRRELMRRAVVAAALLVVPGCRASPSSRPVFAGAAGELPPDGRPTVAGITLPAGRRRAPELLDTRLTAEPSFWCTDTGTERAFELARRLASVFPSTGLWPCLWLHPDRPAAYCDRPSAADRVDAAKARRVLAEQWSRHPPRGPEVAPLGTGFPGLARSTGRTRHDFEPFDLLEQRQRADSAWDAGALRPRLMLVPCRHPAYVVAVIGLECGTTYAGVEDPALVSSVLRSWEQRFRTVLVGLAPGAVLLAVGAPPLTFDEALRIAAEQRALAPAEDAGAPGSLAEQAERLLTPGPPGPSATSSRDTWQLAWSD